LFPSPPARRHLSPGDFPVADHERVGNFTKLGLPDLVAKFLVPEIPFRTEPRGTKRGDRFPRVLDVAIRYGQDVCLDRRKPGGESPSVMFHQDAEESLQALPRTSFILMSIFGP
jgi:hypothetical protein